MNVSILSWYQEIKLTLARFNQNAVWKEGNHRGIYMPEKEYSEVQKGKFVFEFYLFIFCV